MSGIRGRLPVFLYRRTKDSREKAEDHPLFSVLHIAPNPEMTPQQYQSATTLDLATQGDSYSFIERSNAGKVKGLWPLPAARVTPRREGPGRGVIVYEYTPGSKSDRIPANRILHIPFMSTNGIKGMSPITAAREGIGLAIAAEGHGAAFFGNAVRPSGVIEIPVPLDDDKIKELRKQWNEANAGYGKTGGTPILPSGMTWKAMGISHEDAQYIETRIHQVSDICRFWGVYSALINEHSRSTYSNVTELFRSWIQLELPSWWLVPFEQGMERALLTEAERGRYSIRHSVDALLRATFKDRMEAHKDAILTGQKTLNEVRKLEDQPPLPPEIGNVTWIPTTHAPANVLAAGPAPAEEVPQAQPQAEEEGRSRPVVETRSVDARRALGHAYRKVFADVAQRILQRERNNVEKAAEKFLGRNDREGFTAWLDEFYAEHQPWIEEKARPAVQSFAEAVGPLAARDVGLEAERLAELESFVEDYVAAFAQRHVNSSKGQLRSLAQEDEPQAAVQARCDEWGEKRPDKIAVRETVQEANAVTKAVYILAGVSVLRWRAHGKSCPFCTDMDGAIVEVTKWFARAGDTLEAEGRPPLTIRTNVGHPPLHPGCDCSVEPGL